AWEMDSRRFGRHYVSREYTLARTHEVYSTYYDVKYPGHERSAGRPLRVSPAYPRLKELGAAFGEKSGWERANWFEPNAARGDESLRPRGWAGHLWSPAIGAEHLACRESAALFDETSFAKIEVAGEGAAAFLEHLCDNRVARDIVGSVSDDDLSFPYMRARDVSIGPVSCLALRVTYVGELGWELYCPTEFGLRLWDVLWEAGGAHGLVAGGYKAIDSLRLEKGYRVWGADITPDETPYEAGLGFAVKLDKGEFVGREALVAAGEPKRRLVCLTLADPRSV